MSSQPSFDLSKSVSNAPRKYKPKTQLTEEEKKSKLAGYVRIDKEFWTFVKYNSHIRYIKVTGEFVTGGFVAKNPLVIAPNAKGDQDADQASSHIKLRNSFNPKIKGYLEWMVSYKDIAHLYVKSDAVSLQLQKDLRSAVKQLNDNINKDAIFTKQATNK